MVVIPPYTEPVYLVSADGERAAAFASARAAYLALGKTQVRSLVRPLALSLLMERPLSTYLAWADGTRLYCDDFPELTPKPYPRLQLPLGRRCCRTRAYRHPSTCPERRQNVLHLPDEGEPAPRPRRRNLPSTWDDRMRSDYGDRSWKRHRKYQARQR